MLPISDPVKNEVRVNCKCPKGRTLHIIADNYSMHMTKEVREYLESIDFG